jgi:outer membrane protein
MKKLVTLLSVLCLVVSTAIAQAQIKVGIVDYEAVLADMPEYVSGNKTLLEKFDQMQLVISGKENDFETDFQAFIKDSAQMTPETKKESQSKLQSRALELEVIKESAQKEIEYEKEKVLKTLYDKLDNSIATVAKKEKYTLIIRSTAAAYYLHADDVSDKVRKQLGIKIRKG